MQKRMSSKMWGTAISVMSDAAACGLYTCQQRPGHQYIQSQTYLCFPALALLGQVPVSVWPGSSLRLTLLLSTRSAWPGTSICMARYQFQTYSLCMARYQYLYGLPFSSALALHGQVPVSVWPGTSFRLTLLLSTRSAWPGTSICMAR